MKFGWNLTCLKCGQALSVYYGRHYTKDIQIGAILVPNKGDSIIKATCPKHGAFSAKFNNKLKELWMDHFAKAMLRCLKCEELGSISETQEQNGWMFFKIKCPVHGPSEIKKISLPLYHVALKLINEEITYKEYLQFYHPDKYIVCEFCGHTIEPGHKVCENCGEEPISIDLDW